MASDSGSSGFFRAFVLFVVIVVGGVIVMEFAGVTKLTGTGPVMMAEARQGIDKASDNIRNIELPEVSTGSVPADPARTSQPVEPSRPSNPGLPDGYWPEIHSKHFLHGYPLGTPATNDLIIRDGYAMSNNDDTKFADWVAYRLVRDMIESDVKTERKWASDPWLAEDETLEADDYKAAHATIHTDRGHQAPLASFKGTESWHETNFLSNITPQRSELNQGPWVDLENAVRDLVRKRDDRPVYVMTGPWYSDDWEDELPEADEDHRVPAGYWKIVSTVDGDGVIDDHVAFSFSQDTARRADFDDHRVTIDEVENLTGLDFFSVLDDSDEDELESNTGDLEL